jgi:hypothetical protein
VLSVTMRRRFIRSSLPSALSARTEDSRTAFLHHGIDVGFGSRTPEGADPVFVEFYTLLRHVRSQLLTFPLRFTDDPGQGSPREFSFLTSDFDCPSFLMLFKRPSINPPFLL